MRWLTGIAIALVLHVAFILFGGAMWPDRHGEDHGTLQEVDLLTSEEESKKEETDPEPATELETEAEEVPDAAEIIRNLEMPVPNEAPALDAASLSAIEAALSGQGGAGGDFAQSLSFASGGRIGGTGRPGAVDDDLEKAFSLDEIDQRPRPIHQVAPLYPSEIRSKRLEGVVTLLFVVDAGGKVAQARVQKSTHVAFEKPALDAVRRWKFEPAVKGGQRVACKMRVPIRFQPS